MRTAQPQPVVASQVPVTQLYAQPQVNDVQVPPPVTEAIVVVESLPSFGMAIYSFPPTAVFLEGPRRFAHPVYILRCIEAVCSLLQHSRTQTLF